MGERVVGLSALLVLAACPNGARFNVSDDLEIMPDTLQFCCDPAQTVQGVVTIRVTNNGPNPVEATPPGGDPVLIEPGATADVPITVAQCGDHDVTVRFDVNPAYDHLVHLVDRCPEPVADPEDPAIEGTVDLVACESAQLDGGGAWIACETRDGWRPPETLYSWFCEISVKNASGTPIMVCTVQHHDGVDSTFCDVGDVADLELREPSTGPVMLFPTAVDATTYDVRAGVLPTQNGTYVEDTLTGPIGAEIVTPPE